VAVDDGATGAVHAPRSVAAALDRGVSRVVDGLLPARLGTAAGRRLRLVLFAGRRVECPCCGRRFSSFRIPDRELLNAPCPWCGSHIRHRSLWLYLCERTDLLTAPTRLLHVAPEWALEERIRKLANVSYLSADLSAPDAMEHFDLEDIPHPAGSFDAIVCSHALEHVRDDRRAMAELHRVLRPGGWAVILAPIDYSRAETLEDSSIVTPEDRRREYWQEDHMRLYGRDFPTRLEGAGFEVTVDRFLYSLPAEQVNRNGLYSLEDMYRCSKRG
jgi:hypothetical protein